MNNHLPCLLLALVLVSGAEARAQGTQRVSIDSQGREAHGRSTVPKVSADGRYVLFTSDAPDLVPGDVNGVSDVFVWDRLTRKTEMVSIGAGGEPADGPSYGEGISSDGRFVLLRSLAGNLVPADTDRTWGVFVVDRLAGTTEQVSVSPSVGPHELSMSDDGRYVVFSAVYGISGWAWWWDYPKLFMRDRLLRTTTMIVGNGPYMPPYELYARAPEISGDGGHIAFVGAVMEHPLALPVDVQVFDYEVATGSLRVASVNDAGVKANDLAPPEYLVDGVSISEDGMRIAFTSMATNLAPGIWTHGTAQVYVRDSASGTTLLASANASGHAGDSWSENPALSPDGFFVSYSSWASNLVPGDTNGFEDVFETDLGTGRTRRVSVDSAGGQTSVSNAGMVSDLSAGGGNCAFDSLSDDLVPGDTNSSWDVFLFGGPHMDVTGSCPGWMTCTITDATPGGQVVLLWGDPSGWYRIPAGRPVAGLDLDLRPVFRPQPGYVLGRANGQGVVTLVANIPGSACGRAALQAVDLLSGTKTNRVDL